MRQMDVVTAQLVGLQKTNIAEARMNVMDVLLDVGAMPRDWRKNHCVTIAMLASMDQLRKLQLLAQVASIAPLENTPKK